MSLAGNVMTTVPVPGLPCPGWGLAVLLLLLLLRNNNSNNCCCCDYCYCCYYKSEYYVWYSYQS